MIIERHGSRLLIGVKRGRWRDKSGIESGDIEFFDMRPRVLARDNNTCVYCGLSIDKMHVHHVNDDHGDNRLENLVTVDDLCHAVHHVGLLGDDGVIIYMPSLSQEDVNHLCRAMAVTYFSGREGEKEALDLFNGLVERFSPPILESFGSTSPADLGNALLSLSDEDYNARGTVLKDVRVLFKPSALSNFAERSAKRSLRVDGWKQVFRSLLKNAA